jgi:hypothetical protein
MQNYEIGKPAIIPCGQNELRILMPRWVIEHNIKAFSAKGGAYDD